MLIWCWKCFFDLHTTISYMNPKKIIFFDLNGNPKLDTIAATKCFLRFAFFLSDLHITKKGSHKCESEAGHNHYNQVHPSLCLLPLRSLDYRETFDQSRHHLLLLSCWESMFSGKEAMLPWVMQDTIGKSS